MAPSDRRRAYTGPTDQCWASDHYFGRSTTSETAHDLQTAAIAKIQLP